MSKFKVGDLVTTTATRCKKYHDDPIPSGETFRVYSVYGDYSVLLARLALDDAGGLPTRCWWVDRDSLTLADDPDEGGQQHEDKQEGDTHAELKRVFSLAVAQSQSGKGADRHGNGESFTSQPIFTINQALGSNHGALFQVVKKATESARLAATDRKDMAKNELLGAMVYAAAAYLLLED